MIFIVTSSFAITTVIVIGYGEIRRRPLGTDVSLDTRRKNQPLPSSHLPDRQSDDEAIRAVTPAAENFYDS